MRTIIVLAAFLFALPVAACAQEIEINADRVSPLQTLSATYKFGPPEGEDGFFTTMNISRYSSAIDISYGDRVASIPYSNDIGYFDTIDLDSIGGAIIEIDNNICVKLFYSYYHASSIAELRNDVAIDVCGEFYRIFVVDGEGLVVFSFDSRSAQTW